MYPMVWDFEPVHFSRAVLRGLLGVSAATGVWLGWLPGPCWVAGAAVSMEVFTIASGEAGLVRQYKQVLGIFRSLPIEQN